MYIYIYVYIYIIYVYMYIYLVLKTIVLIFNATYEKGCCEYCYGLG